MRPKEVILRTLEGGKADRVPVALIGGGMWSVHHRGITFEDISRNAEAMSGMLVEMAGKLQSDIVYVGSGYPNFPVAALGGEIKYRELGAPDLKSPVAESAEDLRNLDLGAIDTDAVLLTIRKALELTRAKVGDEYVVTLTAWGPFTLGARLVGEEALIRATLKSPDYVDMVLEFATKVLIRFFEPVVSGGSLELITLGDPTASGDLISKKHFQRFAVPYLKKFIDWASSRGVHTLLHICGNTTDRLEMFPLTGASCVSLDQKTDIAKAREVLHGKMCFAGNIDPVGVLLRGTAGDVDAACRGVIEAAGTGGGFILMPGCDIPPNIPYDNIRKFVEVAKQWKP